MKGAEPAVPRHFLIAIVTFKIAMVKGVVKRAQREAAFVFDQQVFITRVTHRGAGALVEDVNTEKDILGLFGASLPDSDAGTSRLDSFSSPPPSSLSDSQCGVSMVIWGFKFDWSAGLEERSLVDLETDAAALSTKAFAFASWCCVWAFCSSTAEKKKKNRAVEI